MLAIATSTVAITATALKTVLATATVVRIITVIATVIAYATAASTKHSERFPAFAGDLSVTLSLMWFLL